LKTPLDRKSTPEDIKNRFDRDVERFSDLHTAQEAVIDAPIMLELISELAAVVKPDAENMLDIGCGAGNNSIMIVRGNPGINCDLVDLSLPMLERAKERLYKENTGEVKTFHGDFRDAPLPHSHYDLIAAAAVLHHLWDDSDWERCFKKIYDLLKPGGALFVSDLVHHEHDVIHKSMWRRYGEYLESLSDAGYRDKVLQYIDTEDSPRSMTYQLELMKEIGFDKVDVLHKNSCFGAYVGVK